MYNWKSTWVTLKSNILSELAVICWEHIVYTKDSNIDSYMRKTANTFVGYSVIVNKCHMITPRDTM